MRFTIQLTHRFYYRWLLLVFLAAFYCLNSKAVRVAEAQEPVKSNLFALELFIFPPSDPATQRPSDHNQSDVTGNDINSTVAQSSSNPTPSQKAPRRPRPAFFEEERRPQFGFGDFVESALDGGENFFSADSITNLSPQFSLNPLSAPLERNLTGTLTVQSRNKRDANYLTTTFLGPNVNLIFTSPNQSADPRIGTITVNGTVTVNGRTITFNNLLRDYRGSFSVRDNDVSGAILVIDPKDPNTSIFIQLPRTTIPNVNNDREPISAPAQFSFGLPSDR